MVVKLKNINPLKHGKCVRQRNVRSDTTKDRAGTLPETAYKVTETAEAVAFEYQSEKVAEEVDEYDDEIESDDDDDVEPGSKYEPRNEYSVETDYSYNLCTRSGRSIRPVLRMDL